MKQRTEIQALRALAVGMVVLFHLKARMMPGGFAGVDVFFVISGYLITSSIFGEIARTRRVDLVKFWSRRARRLLPIALLVILVATVAAFFVQQPFNRNDSFWDSIASTFYFENWRLGSSAADYFSAPTPSIFQHYWSLAVEEQFYLVWPILLIILVRWFKGRSLPLAVAGITAVSFAYNLWLTFGKNQYSYFSTFGRAWEFGVGAIIALWLSKRSKGLHVSVAYLGFGLLAASAYLVSSDQPFPGTLALLPVAGAACVILAQSTGLMRRLTELRPIQWLGDQSYGVYLWHWPVAILLPLAIPTLPTPVAFLLILALTFALSSVSKRFIEDPIRLQRFEFLKSSAKSLTSALVASILLLTFIFAIGQITNGQIAQARMAVSDIQANPCFGARSLAKPSCSNVTLPLAISLDQATHDSADPNNACMTTPTSSAVMPCVKAAPNSGFKRVLLIGDSHAAMYLGPLERIAKSRNWQITLIYKASCAFNMAPRNNTVRGQTCSSWNKAIQTWLSGQKKFDYVFTSYMASNISTSVNSANYPTRFADGFKAAWQQLLKMGSTILVLRDGPKMSKTMASCYSDAKTAAGCRMPSSGSMTQDVAFTLASGIRGVYRIDLTDLVCAKTCEASVGGLFVYRDTHHFSLAYANSLAPFLIERLDQLVGRG